MAKEIKFEIPLTTEETKRVFNIIDEYNEHISYVYAPPHIDYGGSGRQFQYDFDRESYDELLVEINKIKPVIITDPGAFSINRYIDIGITNFMVSYWSIEMDILKQSHPEVKIVRSIVNNAFNERVDKRFDGIVAPYKALLSPKVMNSIKSQIDDITIIPNHFCKLECHALDAHPAQTVNNIKQSYRCPDNTKNLFIPREVLMRILPHITTIKLVDRVVAPSYYVNYMRYYLGLDELQNQNPVNETNIRTINLYKSSNLVTGNCEFNCRYCSKKCY